MKVAIYAGSFDPITNGHLDIIERASKIFDKLYVLVSNNINKKYVFTDEERIDFTKRATKDLENVEVIFDNDLVVNVANKVNATVLIRGIRNSKDYEEEKELNFYNKHLNSKLETILLFTSNENQYVSSSGIKELIKLNGKIDGLVPSCIKKEIYKKIKG